MASPWKDWINVPDGSSFELSLTTIAGAGTGSADIADNEGNRDTWRDATIHPGPASLAIVSPRLYTFLVEVALTGPGTNEIRVAATVRKPNGTQHGSAYGDSVRGKKGVVEVILFTIETA